jgi:hypothetical protein
MLTKLGSENPKPKNIGKPRQRWKNNIRHILHQRCIKHNTTENYRFKWTDTTGTWQMHCWTRVMSQEQAAVHRFFKRVEGLKLFHKYKINIWHWILPKLTRKQDHLRYTYSVNYGTWWKLGACDQYYQHSITVQILKLLPSLQILCFWTSSIILLSLSKTPSCLYYKTQRFRDWILSPSSGKALSIGPDWVGFTWRQRQNPISETLFFVI